MSSESSQPESAFATGALDPAWNGIFTAGAIAAFSYVALGVVAPALLYFPVGYPRTSDGETLLTFIAENRVRWIVLQTLTLGPSFLGMLFLSDQYAVASPERQQDLVAAAEAVTAPLDAYNPLYETVFAAGVLILSLVMLRGVFPKWTAYLGIAAAASELVGFSLLSLIGMGYFWWWLIFAVWFVAVGWGLWRMRPAASVAPFPPHRGSPGEAPSPRPGV